MRINLLFLLDILLYFIFPLCFWDFGRGYFGDYITMIFSTVPGILYTLYRFKITERFNFTGIFIIINLVSGTLVDILSDSAEQLLWNNVFYAFANALIYLVSYLLKKPIHLFFNLDIMVLNGHDQAITKELFYEEKPLKIFNTLTLTYCICECVYAFILINMISVYGVEAFHLDLLLDKTLDVIITGVSLISFIYINNAIDELISVKNMINQKNTRKNRLSYTTNLYQYYLERNFFYFCNHKR